MSQHIEIEFKNLLTKKEFDHLKLVLSFSEQDFRKQANHYFDTQNFQLKKLGCALRIREKINKYELTLKQQAKIGLLETNQTISVIEANTMMEEGTIPSGPVANALLKMFSNKDEVLIYFGTLVTNRAEKTYKDGIIVLDHSIYLNTEDFELEYEVEDEKKGKDIFHQLLNQHHIPVRKTDNKIMRFYQAKKRKLPDKER
ncbi:CYTH domain-containing protein [Bacillus sp. B15-48]|uniref:CYTH domain-containing protein n=1 Tax=Bacillus sp. B15-48 TaxID=1548601 RepID=UPI00193F969F|nr:CYTH domain-containing protein [Bacillus sp. B15-48]MBM4764255.1 CYTH domain-containing protein [Bacillus sp. B15-48]